MRSDGRGPSLRVPAPKGPRPGDPTTPATPRADARRRGAAARSGPGGTGCGRRGPAGGAAGRGRRGRAPPALHDGTRRTAPKRIGSAPSLKDPDFIRARRREHDMSPWTNPTCEFCKRPDATVVASWRRSFPDFDRLRLCGECDARLLRAADDRGESAEEGLRILGLTARLAGEVWNRGEVLLWFRDPLIVRPPEAVPTAPAGPRSQPRAATPRHPARGPRGKRPRTRPKRKRSAAAPAPASRPKPTQRIAATKRAAARRRRRGPKANPRRRSTQARRRRVRRRRR